MGNAKRARKSRLKVSEIMTLCVYYHFSGYKTFKAYYENHVLIHLREEFHSLVSYSRFVELKGKVNLLLVLLAKLKSLSVCTGISIIDSTPLRVCHIRRASSHKTFRGLSKKGYSSTGWFYGLKLHLVINHLGEIVDFAITPGNVSDANKELIEKLSKLIQGLLIGDKGYIGLFRTLYQKGIFLIHKVRKNMKNFPMLTLHRLLLSKYGDPLCQDKRCGRLLFVLPMVHLCTESFPYNCTLIECVG